MIATSTALIIRDSILSVLIFLSDIVFRWIPAALAVITGGQVPVASFDTASTQLSGVTQTYGSSSSGGAQGAPQVTNVGLDATYTDASGTSVPLSSTGSIVHTSPTDTAVLSTTTPPATVTDFTEETVGTAWGVFAPISIFLSLLLAVVAVYSLIRVAQIRFSEKMALKAVAKPVGPAIIVPDGATTIAPSQLSVVQKRWERIQAQIASPEENDWRLAILEADIMLDEVLESRGFTGESLGEKLKSAGTSGFRSIEQAWDAHRARNHIAHRGTSHDLSQHEAKRVISEYHQVFSEFGVL